MMAVGLRWADSAAAKSSPTDARMLRIGYSEDTRPVLHTPNSS